MKNDLILDAEEGPGNWIRLLTVSKDIPGLSESWDINVALIGNDEFAWQTSGSDPDEDEGGAIDTGSAEFIAEYLVENASGFECELVDRLSHVAHSHAGFIPLLKAVRAKLGQIE